MIWSSVSQLAATIFQPGENKQERIRLVLLDVQFERIFSWSLVFYFDNTKTYNENVPDRRLSDRLFSERTYPDFNNNPDLKNNPDQGIEAIPTIALWMVKNWASTSLII